MGAMVFGLGLMTQAELLELLARAKAEGWKKLDLAGMEFEELPPEMGKLV